MRKSLCGLDSSSDSLFQPWANLKSGGTVALGYVAQVQRVKLLALLQLLGFFIIFTCMILMRFGL